MTFNWTALSDALSTTEVIRTLNIRMPRVAQALGTTDHLDPRDFGAAFDGAHDDTTALQAAINSSVASSFSGTALPVRMPSGVAKLTAPLDAMAGHLQLGGNGRDQTKLLQFGTNMPVINLGGYDATLADFTLSYNTPQPSASTGAVALALHDAAWAVIERLAILGCQRGLAPVAPATVGIASSAIRDVFINNFSDTGIDLVPLSGGIDSLVLENIYLFSRDDVGVLNNVNRCMHLQALTNSFVGSIFCQTCRPGGAVLEATSCDALCLSALHFEGLVPRGDAQGFLFLNGGVYDVRGMTAAFNTITAANGIASAFAVLRFGNNTKITLDGLLTRNNTVTGTTFPELLDSGSTAVEIWARGIQDTNDTTGLGTLSDPTVLRQRNGRLVTTPSGSAGAGLRLPHGTAPSSPRDGDLWTTTAGLFVRVNGVTVGPLS